MTRRYRIPAPAERVRAVVCAPLSWPWLTGSGMSVEFERRDGAIGRYRAERGGVSVPFAVERAARSVTLSLTGEDGAPGDAALTWTVGELPDGTSEVVLTTHGEEPALLGEAWDAADLGGALGAWSRDIDRACEHHDPLGAARALAPMLRERAADSEAARTLDASSVAALRAAGLFRLGPPKPLGGLDARPGVIVSAIAELSRADAAAGWCTFIGNQSAYSAWLEEDVATELAGPDGGLILAGSTAVSGTAEPRGNGTVEVNGRWRFNSGCLHADWLMAGVSVPTAEGAVPMLAFLPWDAVTILDTWHVAGLSGTGSHDLVLDRVEVPRRRLAPLFTAPAAIGETLHKLSPYNIQAVLMAGLPLGIAWRALDEVPPADGTTVPLARLETELAAARALVLETVDGYWSELAGAETLPASSGARLALVLRHAADTAKRVTSAAVRLAGPEVTGPGHAALRRCLRDAFATGQHLAVSDDIVARNAARLYPEGAT
ncbi:acyl-CoA dehydrogenase family protein [Prauserella flavalba]|uniref:hypothetical protein n=1 Tax=Prauserella flavalba TaxID=1477506 RepID=UPI0036F157C5